MAPASKNALVLRGLSIKERGDLTQEMWEYEKMLTIKTRFLTAGYPSCRTPRRKDVEKGSKRDGNTRRGCG